MEDVSKPSPQDSAASGQWTSDCSSMDSILDPGLQYHVAQLLTDLLPALARPALHSFYQVISDPALD